MNRWTPPRPNRSALIRSADTLLHLYNRGVDRQVIFFCRDHYLFFLALIRRFLVREQVSLLAYCLMPNHFHFLVRQLEALAISHFMEQLCGEYAKAINQARQRTGHLFQRRYGMKWVCHAGDIVPLANYIHQNPVKAGLVASPEEWEYSSCRQYCDPDTSSIVAPGEVLSLLKGEAGYASVLAGSGDAEFELPINVRFRE